MAIDLTGIGNVNEFYTQYYLQAILEGDLRGVFEAWGKLETAPPDALRQLARTWRDSSDGSQQEDWWDAFFTALGYPLRPAIRQMGDYSFLPHQAVVARFHRLPIHGITLQEHSEGDALSAEVFGAD